MYSRAYCNDIGELAGFSDKSVLVFTSVHLNGEKTIEFKTNEMIFGVEKYIHEITKYITLYPGDMIWMGTDGEGKNMSDGDTCEITISGIGTLKNHVRKIQ